MASAGGTSRLFWKCRVVFSLQSAEVGTEQTFEWEPDGAARKVWHVGSDGRLVSGGAVRRPKSRRRGVTSGEVEDAF